ncbi:GIY-YIG nuclease family protein [Ferrimonas balearica]|uniref:GIY-YIG nuclease family protein n=1 Tax=Ferrimonas balearica TaxID=44012 RepID=UPI001C9464E0|nr:GIY-YIG nuclease family protein [Ferrimonas balearica]MBY5980892.1 GIY-YIG nuclease family protein [Ferrimonas balearica]
MNVGIVYHLRPQSNFRFCKVGRTHGNGRSVSERIRELNNMRYGGFSDWVELDKIVVHNCVEVERKMHGELNDYMIGPGSEKEMFYVEKDEVKNFLTNTG